MIEIPPNVILADENFSISQDVDLLLGANLFWKLLKGSPIQLKENQPYFENSKLGWILGGEIFLQNTNINLSSQIMTIHFESNLESQLVKFWEDEEVISKVNLTSEHLECENHFCKNTQRTDTGRFITKLPFRNDFTLGESYPLAFKQFMNLERRLQRNLHLNK